VPESVVRWYVNELIGVGIYIQSSRGRNGGYMLNKKIFCK
jgi:DNA-binding IscR family transcriptional regulator